jgi:hypothetical protein
MAILLALAACGPSDDQAARDAGRVDSSVVDSGPLPDAQSCYSPLDGLSQSMVGGAQGCECMVTNATRVGYCRDQGSFVTCGTWRTEEPGARRRWQQASDGPCAPGGRPSAEDCVAAGGLVDAVPAGYVELPPRAGTDGGASIRCALPVHVLAEDCMRAGLRVVPASSTCARRAFIVGSDAGDLICCE